MKRLLTFSLLAIGLLISCEKHSVEKSINSNNELVNPDFEFLKGTWIDKESYGLLFLDFFSEYQARFGMYSKNFERYDSFNYRLFDNQIAIDFIGDNESQETFHDLTIVDNETIEISDLTSIPENPNKIYLKRELVTERINDTIKIGHNQIFYDFNNEFRLQIDSVLNDSRCPIGAVCVWKGNAEIRFDLITGGNYHYLFKLNTNTDFRTDTVIDGIKFTLVGLKPYPKVDESIEQKDYTVKILTENQ